MSFLNQCYGYQGGEGIKLQLVGNRFGASFGPMKIILVPFESFQGQLSPFRASSGGNRFGASFGPMKPILVPFEPFQAQLSRSRTNSSKKRFQSQFWSNETYFNAI